jgi:hypothetical protein
MPEFNKFKQYFIKKEWEVRAGQKKQLPGAVIITLDCCVIGSLSVT